MFWKISELFIIIIFNLLIYRIKTFCFIAIKRIRLGIGKYATKNRMVKAWAEANAFRRSVCLRSKMSKKWYQKFPPVYPSLSSQALAFRKTKRRKRIDQVTIDSIFNSTDLISIYLFISCLQKFYNDVNIIFFFVADIKPKPINVVLVKASKYKIHYESLYWIGDPRKN